MWTLAQDPQGCHLVQAALEESQKDKDLVEVACELKGHVPEAATHRHANFVLQKVIEYLQPQEYQFVVIELVEAGPRVARNRCGCRIPIRLIEKAAKKEREGDRQCQKNLRPLIDKLLEVEETASLVEHKFGHHVVEAILKQGEPKYREHIAKTLLADLVKYATDRTASYVVEIALAHCSTPFKREMLTKLSNKEDFASLADNEFGSFVVTAVLNHPELDATTKDQLVDLLTTEHKEKLLQTKHGVRLLESINPSRPFPTHAEAWMWSAPVREISKNGKTYVDAIIFLSALDKRKVRTKDTGSFSITFCAMQNLKLDKITTQNGKETTREEYIRLISEARTGGPKPPPGLQLVTPEDLRGKLKMQNKDGKIEELFADEVTLLFTEILVQSGKSMSFIDFVTQPGKEQFQACFPIRVQVPRCQTQKQELKTTIKLRNLPSHYGRDDVVALLSFKGFQCKYDFVYVPSVPSSNNGYNTSSKHGTTSANVGLGYAFVNMGTSFAENMVAHTWAVDLWEVLEGCHDWPGETCAKECEVSWGSSDYQGKDANIKRFWNSPVMKEGEDPQFKPTIFDDRGNVVNFPTPPEHVQPS